MQPYFALVRYATRAIASRPFTICSAALDHDRLAGVLGGDDAAR